MEIGTRVTLKKSSEYYTTSSHEHDSFNPIGIPGVIIEFGEDNFYDNDCKVLWNNGKENSYWSNDDLDIIEESLTLEELNSKIEEISNKLNLNKKAWQKERPKRELKR